ncbi:glycosyltransferase family 4 protein [Corynebacterium phocae]|uniref:glycosyltransferase family 4 protein n=1 Tax=Corynebacterium phocae TaxID=161895 RepID=UPI00095118A4|nr:glycosyltransferase family 4 protein [Corynebacterium phocae]KAA8726517.1 glycosyltransferase [Corynebacterium phocae]
MNYELPGEILKSRDLPLEAEPRVLYFATNSLPHSVAGYSIRTQSLLEALVSNGIEARCCTRLGYPLSVGRFAFRQVEEINGVRYSRMLPLWMPLKRASQLKLAVKMLVKEAERSRVTVIHTTTDYTNAYIASRAADILGIPWVYEIRGERHNTWLSVQSPSGSPTAAGYYPYAVGKEHDAIENAAGLAVLTVGKFESIREKYPDKKICLIPNGISTKLKKPGRDSSPIAVGRTKSHRLLVGSISSLVPYEGFETLIQALPYLPDSVEAILVGEGVHRKKLEKEARDLAIADRVTFVGSQDYSQIDTWYEKIDIFVVPRLDKEVTRNIAPIKHLRAMQLGKPVVASDLPALVEATGGLACYFPPGDAKALSEKILGLCRNEIDYEYAEIQDWIKTRTWNSNACKLAQMYRSE